MTTGIFQRQPLAPLTGGTGSGSWPTPRVSMANGPSQSEIEAGDPYSRLETAVQVAERETITSLSVLARNDFRRADGSRAWTTPTARLGMSRGAQAKRYHDPARSNELDDAVAASGTPGSLNPTWVEWLMGFPLGHTEVE